MQRGITKVMLVMLIAVCILFGGIFGFQAFKAHKMQQAMMSMAMPPVTVSAMKAAYQDWQSQAKAVGSVDAVQGVDVTTELAGMVRSIAVKPGVDVKQGELLVQLNIDTDVAQLHSLEATAELAGTVYKRDKAQFAITAVSKAVLDSDAASLKSAIAQVVEQQATIAKKTIRAPFSGRTGIQYVNEGQYINPGDKIVTLQTLDPIYVDFAMPQQVLAKLAVGQPVTITSDSYPGQIFMGKITTIDPKVDPTTRNVQVEVTLPNPRQQLLPGMFTQVTVNTGQPQRYLTLPQTAISFNPYGEIVFLIKESGKDQHGNPQYVVSQSFVTVGETRGDQVAVLSGLKEGDYVVTSGGIKLKNGSAVVVNNAVVPANNPAPIVPEE